MSAIYKREMRSYLTGITGMLFIGILILCVGFMVFTNNLFGKISSFATTLYMSQIILILIVPILCMRSMAEDKHNKTDMFLLSLPLKTTDIVLGKYLALLTVFALPMALISLYPLILGLFGQMNYLTTYSAVLGFFLLGAALIALCQYISSLTESQVIAAVLGVVTVFALFSLGTISSFIPSSALASFIAFAVVGVLAGLFTFYMTRNVVVSLVLGLIIIIPVALIFIIVPTALEATFPTLLMFCSPFMAFENISQGIFDLAAVVTLISHIVLFTFLTNRSVDRKRWS